VKYLKSITSIALALTTVLGLSGCGSSTLSTQAQQQESADAYLDPTMIAPSSPDKLQAQYTTIGSGIRYGSCYRRNNWNDTPIHGFTCMFEPNGGYIGKLRFRNTGGSGADIRFSVPLNPFWGANIPQWYECTVHVGETCDNPAPDKPIKILVRPHNKGSTTFFQLESY
jgi:hypothetical protein